MYVADYYDPLAEVFKVLVSINILMVGKWQHTDTD